MTERSLGEHGRPGQVFPEQFLLHQLRQRPWSALPLNEPIELRQLPTPALVLNRPAMLRNLARMRDHLGAHGKLARPHAKTHKCPLIAHAQLAHGATGLCAAKPGEAAALVLSGVQQVLITSPLTSPGKIAVVGELAREAEMLLSICFSKNLGGYRDGW